MSTHVKTSTLNPPVPSGRPWGTAGGVLLLIILTLLVAEIDKWIGTTLRGQGVAANPLEYPLTAILVGIVANVALRAIGLFTAVRPAIRTELFLKIGLVMLGARLSLGDLLATGASGLLQALIMVTSVFLFAWWLGGRFGLPSTLKAVMASAVSICGVSAAIAAAGAVMARKEEVSYVTSLVIVTALPLMLLMPWLAQAMGLSPDVAGAWFAGNIDNTAAVVGAGTLYGAEAQAVAAVVKLSQNVLIGFVAFGLALHFAVVVNRNPSERPSLSLIWQRFPKFVLGFVLVSVLASFQVFTPSLIKEINTATQWAFAAAFVCIGLEFSLAELKKAGWRPVAVYMIATIFNTILALAAAYVIFGLMG